MKLGAMDMVLSRGEDAEVFERARRLSLDGVEINLKVAELNDPACPRPERLRELAAKHGVSIPSMVLGEHNHGGLATWWRDPEQTADEVRRAIGWCGKVGAATLLVPFFFLNEPKGATHRAVVVERLRPLCDAAGAAGVTLTFEGVLPAAQLCEMARQINSPHFGIYYDPANATWCDYDIAAEVRLLGPLLRQTHVKEARTFTGDAHAGEGRVNWTAFAAALREIHYGGWFVLETPVGDETTVAPDVAFARRTFAEK